MVITYEDAIKRAERAVEIAHHRYCEALEEDCRRPEKLDIARRMLTDAQRILTRIRESKEKIARKT